MSRSEVIKDTIKDLMPVEVFDFYDAPTFYSCQDKAGQLYVVYWVEEDQDSRSWLYLKISGKRYSEMRRGNITIHRVLSQPEEGYVYLVRAASSGLAVSQLDTSGILPDWLPPEGDRLAIPTSSLPAKTESAKEAAFATLRHVLDLAFERPANKYEIGCGRLGRLLDAVQNTLYSLACGQDANTRRVPDEVKHESEALVTGLFTSSFGIRLQSRTSDMFSGDKAAISTEQLALLLGDAKVPELISERLKEFNVLTRSRFKHLIRMLVEAEVSLKTDWGSPGGGSISSQTSYRELARTLAALDRTDEATTQKVERVGKLVGVDVESDFFALMLEDREIIKGRLAKKLVNRHFEIPSLVVAGLEETCVIDPLTEREKWTYVLIEFREISQG